MHEIPASGRQGRIGVLSVLGRGHAPGLADIAIAATAIERGYTLLTRNLRHFDPLLMKLHDPFETLPNDLLRSGRE